MISATHTHSSPGGYNLYMLFDLTTFGYMKQSFNALARGITLVNKLINLAKTELSKLLFWMFY